MRTIVLFKFLLLPLVVILPVSRPSEPSSTTFGVFAGTSLCADFSRPLLNIPSAAQCDRTKWNLTLYVDPVSKAPTTYKLSSEYGYHIDNRTLVMKGSNVREGKWAIVKGASYDPDATVYQLDPATPQISISFQEIDPNIIHLLDRGLRLVVGSAAQSFTLSRTDKLVSAAASPATEVIKTFFLSESTLGSSQLGIFAGRSPCREVAQQLKHPVSDDCFKLKWELTLYQKPFTREPTRFKLRGTLFRDYDREGKWTLLRGRPGDPHAVVYKLDFDKTEKSLFFLRSGEDLLFFLHNDRSMMVGNSDFSYTLNRDK